MNKKGLLQIGKWHFKFGIIPVYWRTHGYIFHFGIFKLKEMPYIGETIQPKNYKGFWLRKEFEWKGFEINF